MAAVAAGIFEFVFGGSIAQRESLLEFWAMLGFTPVAEGHLNAAQAEQLYGHRAELHSLRLTHPGCSSFGTGQVRLQLWSSVRNEGLGNRRPIETGSRWMGMYTRDLLQLRDAFENSTSQQTWQLWISPPVNAPLANPAPKVTFFQPFVGLRELLVFGTDFRLAFIQRGGFDRPGFGTFDETLPYQNTEGSHANVVQPARRFDTDFYKALFGYETAPFGDAHDSGDEPPTITALKLKPDELFRVERIRAPGCPSGLLQVYSSYLPGDDVRDLSRPGSRNLCAYSVRTDDPGTFSDHLAQLQPGVATKPHKDEFGDNALCFDAPDGYAWIASDAA